MKRTLCLLLLPMQMMACSTISDWIYGNPPRTSLRQITVSTDLAANSDNATMLDFVFVYEASALARLPKTGPEWFEQKDALQKALASGIDIVSLQVPAGSPDFQVAFPARASQAIGVYALANYLTTDGQPIANLTPWKKARIQLQAKTITFSGN